MTPAFSSARTRLRHALGERLTRAASSWLVRLPSRCSRSRRRRSVRLRRSGGISVHEGGWNCNIIAQTCFPARDFATLLQPGRRKLGRFPSCRARSAMSQSPPFDNPAGTDGFEFVEYTAPDPHLLGALFEQMGFTPVARHRSKDVILYRQGAINFIVNREPDSFAQSFARVHGPSACAFGMRVKDAAKAYQRAIDLGARPFHGKVGPMELNIPAIEGIGGSLIYLVDRYPGNGGNLSIYDVDFVPIDGASAQPRGAGLLEIDHLTHNVYAGRMDVWYEFYNKLFGFREIRYFDIRGQKTGLTSRALTSPCGKIRIPINEPSDQGSQIQEYLDAYKGEGIQHIALSCGDIYATVEQLRGKG